MYYEEKWIDGWLWTRGTPTGAFVKATAEQTIARLNERLAQAETCLGERS